jgi:chromosomal replication initiation ATPase DnaA
VTILADDTHEVDVLRMKRAGVFVVVRRVLEDAGFTVDDFLGHAKTPPRLNRARFAIWRECYDRRDEDGRRVYSTPELGRLFNRDHTTIMAGIRAARGER